MSAYMLLIINEVAEAVSITDDGWVLSYVDVEYIRRRCQNFVVEKDDGFLEFAHESARLFLEEKEIHGDRFSDNANHREMATTCLQLMRRCDHHFWVNNKVDLTQLEQEFQVSINVTRRRKGGPSEYAKFVMLLGRRGFASYAIFHWTEHCRKLGSRRTLGPKLSLELTDVLLGPRTLFSAWCRFFLRTSVLIGPKIWRLRRLQRHCDVPRQKNTALLL